MIEQGFQALEKKQDKIRTYFEPLSVQETNRIQSTGRLSSARHRYADTLDWADDVTTLMSADDPVRLDYLRRMHTRIASATAASSAGRMTQHQSKITGGNRRPVSAPAGSRSAGSALQAALLGALEAARRPASPLPPSRGFESRLIDEFLRSNSLQQQRDSDGDGSGPLPLIQEGVEEVQDGLDGTLQVSFLHCHMMGQF